MRRPSLNIGPKSISRYMRWAAKSETTLVLSRRMAPVEVVELSQPAGQIANRAESLQLRRDVLALHRLRTISLLTLGHRSIDLSKDLTMLPEKLAQPVLERDRA